MAQPLEIDGRTLEGGGQLVRLAVGVSSITGKPIRIHHIRGGRPRGGGLKAQHLTAIRWLAKACNARVEGVEVRSQSLVFEPGCGDHAQRQWWDRLVEIPNPNEEGGKFIKARQVNIDLGGVGAVTLVLQAVLPFLLFRSTNVTDNEDWTLPILLTMRGGTNVSFSPSVDYVEQVLFLNLALLGLPHMALYQDTEHKLRRGWSHGRQQIGEVSFLIHPLRPGQTLNPLLLPSRRGHVTRIDITIIAHGLMTRRLVQQMTEQSLESSFPTVEGSIFRSEESGDSKRLYLLLVAHTESGFSIGRDLLYDGRIGKGTAGIQVAVDSLVKDVVAGLDEELASDVDDTSGGVRCLDAHMQDQVVVYMALAEGRSRCDKVKESADRVPTLHARTARWVVGEMLGISFDEDGSCEGVGLRACSAEGVRDHSSLE